MCVAVTLEPDTLLSLKEVERMYRSNADGVGVAWAQGGVVSWWKTHKVDPDYVVNVIRAWRGLPRLVHFRFATAGGTSAELCHPFEVGPLASCAPQGTSSRVMIHNGHWNRWQEVKELLDKENLLPDRGPWSDSRLAAWLAHSDPEWFEALGGRVAVMNGDGDIKRLGDWDKLRKGIYVSNKSWDHDATYARGGYTGYRQWKGWGWTEDEYQSYFADKEAAQALAEELEKEAKAKWKKVKEERREAKKLRRAARKNGTGGDVQEGSGGGGNEGTTPGPSCQLQESTPVQETGFIVINGRKYANRPWKNHNTGKWHQVVQIRGNPEVVEVIPPSEEGPAGSGETD